MDEAFSKKKKKKKKEKEKDQRKIKTLFTLKRTNSYVLENRIITDDER